MKFWKHLQLHQTLKQISYQSYDSSNLDLLSGTHHRSEISLYARGSSISWKVLSHLASTVPCYKHYCLDGKTRIFYIRLLALRIFPLMYNVKNDPFQANFISCLSLSFSLLGGFTYFSFMTTTSRSYLNRITYHLTECPHPSAFQGTASRRYINLHKKKKKRKNPHLHISPLPMSLLSNKGVKCLAKGLVGTHQKAWRGALLALLAFLNWQSKISFFRR